MKRSGRWWSLLLAFLVICLLGKPETSQAQPCEFDGDGFLFLRGVAPNLDLEVDSVFLPAVPTFIDSPLLTKAGGYKPIGTWTGVYPGCGAVFAYHPHVWLGLRNSDDEGTQFDLRAELLRGGIVVAQGEIHCVKGVTRNPAKAKEVLIPFNGSGPPLGDPSCGPSDEFTVEADSELSLRLYARIAADGLCRGHSSSSGLRLYYDADSRPSHVLVTNQAVCCTPGCDEECGPHCLPPIRD